MANSNLKSTQAANLTSVVASTTVGFVAEFSKVVSCQAVWTSTTLSGSLTLQYSLDNVNWVDFQAATSITNTSSNVLWNINSTATAASVGIDTLYWRVNVVRTSGTYDTLKVYFGNITR